MLPGLSEGDEDRSDKEFKLETSDLGSAWAGTCAEYEATQLW